MAAGDLCAFSSADRLAAYAGLVPTARDSGKRVGKARFVGEVALQAPLLTGPLLATLLVLTLGAPPHSLLLWMLASVVFWGVVLTGGAALGFSIFGA